MSKTITLNVLLFCLISASQLPANGQSNDINKHSVKASDFNTWDFGSSIGLTFPRTDITGTGGKFGISFDATKFLSHSFALQARLMHSTIAGEDVNRPDYQYNSTINYDITVNVIFQSTNLIILPQSVQDRLALYASVGAGIVNYSPDIWLDGGYFRMHGIYSQYSQPYDTFDYSGSTDFMLPVSFGAKYRISDRVSISAEYSYRITNSDKLDGFFKLLSNNDSYSFFNAGLVFHLGKKRKVLEWENPVSNLYHDIDSLESKLKSISNDSDKDGVADVYDKEQATPIGTRVYGDGTSVDTDNDGVPDRIDEEPYSARNAKVDANGKEIRKEIKTETKTETSLPPVVNTPVIEPTSLTDVTLPMIYFDYDKSGINKKYNEAMGIIARNIKSNPNSKFRIIAICDDSKKMYNVDLSNRRAESVKNHLIKYYKINPALLYTEVEFVPPDPASVEKNRRVEVRVK